MEATLVFFLSSVAALAYVFTQTVVLVETSGASRFIGASPVLLAFAALAVSLTDLPTRHELWAQFVVHSLPAALMLTFLIIAVVVWHDAG